MHRIIFVLKKIGAGRFIQPVSLELFLHLMQFSDDLSSRQLQCDGFQQGRVKVAILSIG